MRSSRGHVNNEWRERVYRPYAQGLAGRYPLNARSSNELALQDFSEFFKPAGTLDAFFQEYMKPFLNTRGTWGNRSVGDNNMGFSANTLRQVRRAMAIRNAFFRANPETPTIRMELRPQSMDEQHARFTLELGDERVTYRHGPKFWKTLNWSGDDDNKRIRVIFEDLDGQVYEQTYEGPWAWFRFQDASSLKPIRGSNVYLATFYVRDKNSRDHKITYEIRAKSANNPFRKGLLSSFRSPESI
ncbi:MAG: type VI secretion IcmF C-terminal domain-containing protein [Pseudomonadota bacterium]